MAAQFRFWENLKAVSLLTPAADSAGRTGAVYVNVSGAHKATIIAYINQGAASTVLLTPLQATDSAGTGSKAIAATPIAVVADFATSDSAVAATAAANYTTDAGTKTKMVMFEIQPQECMDVANGFNHISLSTGASSASNITSAMVVLGPLRYAGNPSPTAIT